MKKVDFPIDKHKWSPSLIPGPIVLISTYNKNTPHIAPKSWLQMVSFDPPIIMFSGTKKNTTEKNIMKNKCFGINFVDSSMVSKVYKCIKWSGQERNEKLGVTFTPGSKVNAPLVNECKAHLECKVCSTKEIGSGFVIFGEIVAASIWENIMKASYKEKYELLDLVEFLEIDLFSKVTKYSVNL